MMGSSVNKDGKALRSHERMLELGEGAGRRTTWLGKPLLGETTVEVHRSNQMRLARKQFRQYHGEIVEDLF